MKLKSILTFAVVAFFAVSTLSSCSFYSRLIEVEASGGRTDAGKNIVFENDTVRVEYNLWGENGNMYFNVYNKLTVPLYVDWYKCAYIEGERKYDYTGVIKERKSFIPPLTKVSNPVQYYLLGDVNAVYATSNASGSKVKITSVDLRNDKNSTVEQVNKTYKKKGKEKVYSKTYTAADSPLNFRSFITVSTCESADECTNGRNMLFINNSFYVKKISEMRQRQFLGKSTKVSTVVKKGNKTVKGRMTVYEYPYRSGNSFYIPLVF